MVILDSHLHLGDCRVFDQLITEEMLFETMEKYGVEKAILQPYPGAEDEKDIHERIYKLTKQYPDKFFGVASVNPHLFSKQDYKNYIRHYIEDFGFYGVKLHTIGHAVNPLTPDGQTVCETAAELGVTLFTHTGLGVPFSLPSLIMPVAKRYPEMKIVFAHSGAGFLSSEALIIAEQCPNIYLEMSWVNVEDTEKAIDTIGSGRIMYGSDSLYNFPTGINIFESIPLSDEQKADVFFNTAVEAFDLRI